MGKKVEIINPNNVEYTGDVFECNFRGATEEEALIIDSCWDELSRRVKNKCAMLGLEGLLFLVIAMPIISGIINGQWSNVLVGIIIEITLIIIFHKEYVNGYRELKLINSKKYEVACFKCAGARYQRKTLCLYLDVEGDHQVCIITKPLQDGVGYQDEGFLIFGEGAVLILNKEQ